MSQDSYSSYKNFHLVPLTQDTDLSRLHFWKAHTFESEHHRLLAKICLKSA